MWAYVGAHPVLWRAACGHACQAVRGEADIRTRMHKRESIKPHVKQTQHVLASFSYDGELLSTLTQRLAALAPGFGVGG